MSFRQLVLITHRWLGLGASSVLAIVGMTGTFLVAPDLPLRRFAGPIHERLALGTAGSWLVTLATISAVLLELGGCYLWWKRKLFRVRIGRGWREALTDIHHVAGVVAFALMFLLALSGVGMAFVIPQQHPGLRRVIMDLHTARTFPVPVKLLYVAGTCTFVLQGVTGVVMWWRLRPR